MGTCRNMENQERMTKETKKRNASIELLRSIAMLMVISMHYLDKGGITIDLDMAQTIPSILAWLLHSFCIVAVNCYVLISGYYLVEQKFKWQKLVRLVCEILFYSILVPVVMALVGLLPLSEINLYKVLLYVLPIQTKHYWFATSYLLMFILSPVLAAGVKALSKKQLQLTIGILLLVFSVSKTFLPFQMELDTNGYDVTWFIVLFLIAGYIRLYGIDLLPKNKCNRGLWIYLIGSLGTFLWAFAVRALSMKLGKFGYFVTRTFDYNHLLCLISSVGLFLFFLYREQKENALAKFARKIGPYTFGVYLLHEQWEMRHVWPVLLHTEEYATSFTWILHWILSILLVFVIGIVVDFLRNLLFNGVEKVIHLDRKKNG